MKVWLEIGVANHSIGRLQCELLEKQAPKTVENFRCLCTGEKGITFKGSRFHRLIPGFMIQGGDITNGDGTGGESIYGKQFPDEPCVRSGKHNRRGLLSMANSGPDTNGSQFFILFAPAPHLNGKHVVFGEVKENLEILDTLEQLKTEGHNKPIVAVSILDCGQVDQVVGKAVEKQVENNSKRLKRDAEKLQKASEGASFPVPTMDNPSAVYEDGEARRNAQERLDKRNAEDIDKQLASGNLRARKRKLLELRKRKAQARTANHEQVVEEHRRFSAPKKKKEGGGNEEWEKVKKKREDELTQLGVTADKSYLLETAEAAQKKQAKKDKKLENIEAGRFSHHLNQDHIYRSYNKSVAKLAKNTEGVTSGSLGDAVVNYGVDSNTITDEAKERVAKAMQPKKSRVRGAKARLDEENVTAINDVNERYNKKLAKDYDKYTVELRQNLERGTAL